MSPESDVPSTRSLACVSKAVSRTNDLIYQILDAQVRDAVQAHVALLRDDMDNVKARSTPIDTRLGLVHTDMVHQPERQ